MTVQIQLQSVDRFVDISQRWNSNEEIASILVSARSHHNWLRHDATIRPSSSVQILYSRRDGTYYKADGYLWKKRKDGGKIAREDHMKLKVKGVELMYANYVHSAVVPTFHRRTYWLLEHRDIVLVHYLNVPNEDSNDNRPMADKIAACIRTNCNGGDIGRDTLEEQMRSIFATSMCGTEIDSLIFDVYKSLHHHQSTSFRIRTGVDLIADNLTVPDSSSATVSTAAIVSNALIVEQQKSLIDAQPFHLQQQQQQHSSLGRSNSCSSAFRRGLSSLAMHRQPSTFSDSVDQEFIGGMMNTFAQSPMDSSCDVRVQQMMTANDSAYCSFTCDHRMQSDTTGNSPDMAIVNDADRYRQPATVRSRTDSFTSNRISLWETSSTASNLPTLSDISDFSPDWSYPEGNIKILISGPWYLRGHEYSVIFDGIAAPATLIQAGVLRCFCPAHCPANVQLKVACDTQIISNSVTFNYINRVCHENINEADHQRRLLIEGLIQRLDMLQKFVRTGVESPPPNDAPQKVTTVFLRKASTTGQNGIEQRLIFMCNRLKKYAWKSNEVTSPTSSESTTNSSRYTLLHMAAVLGFDRLISVLLDWRVERSPPIYIRDLDVMARDSDGRTPLHLASMNGRIACIKLLVKNCVDTVDVLDDRGETPSELALRYGLKEIAVLIGQLCRRPDMEHVDSTALWVLTNGETVTDEQRLDSVTRQQQQPIDTHRVHVLRHQQTVDSPDLRNHVKQRERKKRASIECLEEVLMDSNEIDHHQHASVNGVGDPDDDDVDSSFAPPDDHQCSSDELSDSVWLKEPLSVDIPMDVHVPDSPKTAHMWQAMTSPGLVVNDGVRAQMASLAQQIIDALPERIKTTQIDMNGQFLDAMSIEQQVSSNGLSMLSKNPYLTSASAAVSSTGDWEELLSPLDSDRFRFESDTGAATAAATTTTTTTTTDPLDVFSPSSIAKNTSSSPYCTDAGRGGGDFDDMSSTSITRPLTSTKDLGDFFNALDDDSTPLERHFQDLRLSDREQRELYEAAKIIQTAYRQYKARLSSQKQLDAERTAAVVIQSYYRRYKQFCYFKKLHKAAVLIQKHFRLNKAARGHMPNGDNIADSPSSYIRLEVPPPNANLAIWRQHLAAMRIQHAFRGHYMRKRQAAARKIQKFMRESKQKLRKVHESNEGDCLNKSATMVLVVTTNSSSQTGCAHNSADTMNTLQ